MNVKKSCLSYAALIFGLGLMFTGTANATMYSYSGVITYCDPAICVGGDALVNGAIVTGKFDVDTSASSTFDGGDITAARSELFDPASEINLNNPLVFDSADGAWEPSILTSGTTGPTNELSAGNIVLKFLPGYGLPDNTYILFDVLSGTGKVCLNFAGTSVDDWCLEGTAGLGTGKVLAFDGTFTRVGCDQVLTNVDSGPGSLRQCVADAIEGETITFSSGLDGATIALAGSQLLIDKSLTIDASNLPGGLTVSGSGTSRVFQIAAGKTVVMRGLTVTDGVSNGGGAILNAGTLDLFDSTLFANDSSGVGGALSSSGIATLVNCTLVANTAGSFGGAISINSGGAVTLIHTTVVNNSAANEGGGIDNDTSTLNIENSLVALNTAPGGPDINLFTPLVFNPSGANLIGDNQTVSTQLPAGPLAGTAASPLNPMLAPLRTYGGATRTKPPLAGSPAIDAAISTPRDPVFDQTGTARPVGIANDLGAVEEKAPDTDGDGKNDDFDSDDDNDTIPDTLELLTGRDPLVTDWAVSAAGFHTCALDDAGVTCWGSNNFDQTTVPTLSNPVAVSAAGNHSCALDDDGVTCWGDNDFDQITVPSLTNPVAVSAGNTRTCALDDAGVTCWGDNGLDQTTVPSLTNPIAVSAGNAHTCALDDTGVTCWGNNDNGQITVPTLTNPVAVGAGRDHTCALDDIGVTCWGSNNFGQTTVPPLTNPVALSTGDYHACALDDVGVTCWGLNNVEQTTVPALTNPVAVSAGYLHTCALEDAGVTCWGNNGSGQSTVPALSLDKDLDGVLDSQDALPLDANESVDTDSDGVGNNADSDDDNDGLQDSADAFPLASIAGYTDTDNDGAPNDCDAVCLTAGMSADADDDNDGFSDAFENEYSGAPYFLNPLVDNGARPMDDVDNDGASLFSEISNGSFDNDFDSDDDGLTDGYEINHLGSDPTDENSGPDQNVGPEGDVNDDGEVNVGDMLRLQQIILGN